MILDKRKLDQARINWEEIKGDKVKETPQPGDIYPCSLCGELFQVPDYVGSEPLDLVCNECFKTYMDTAKVVCLYCNSVVGRVVPKVLDCGYEIKPRSILHTDRCGVCLEDIQHSTLMEIANWIAHHRRPIVYMTNGKTYTPKK